MFKGLTIFLLLSMCAYQVMSFCIFNKLDKPIKVKADWPDKKIKVKPCKKPWEIEVKPHTEECCAWVEHCCTNVTKSWMDTKVKYDVGCEKGSIKIPADGYISFKKSEGDKVNVTQYDEKALPMENGNYLICDK